MIKLPGLLYNVNYYIMVCVITFRDYLEGVRNANIDDSDIELLVDELFYAELFIVI